MEYFGRILAFSMGLNFFLLAYQVDNVTGVFGWIFRCTSLPSRVDVVYST
jgi:hypothetical protein